MCTYFHLDYDCELWVWSRDVMERWKVIEACLGPSFPEARCQMTMLYSYHHKIFQKYLLWNCLNYSYPMLSFFHNNTSIQFFKHQPQNSTITMFAIILKHSYEQTIPTLLSDKLQIFIRICRYCCTKFSHDELDKIIFKNGDCIIPQSLRHCVLNGLSAKL